MSVGWYYSSIKCTALYRLTLALICSILPILLCLVLPCTDLYYSTLFCFALVDNFNTPSQPGRISSAICLSVVTIHPSNALPCTTWPLSCSALFCLFCFVLFCPVLICTVLLCSVLLCFCPNYEEEEMIEDVSYWLKVSLKVCTTRPRPVSTNPKSAS